MVWSATVVNASEPVPVGEYPAILVGTEETESTYGPTIRFEFVLSTEDKWNGQEVSGLASDTRGPEMEINRDSKLGRWVIAILGHTPVAGQKITADELVNKPCLVTIKHNKATDGRVFANVEDVRQEVPF